MRLNRVQQVTGLGTLTSIKIEKDSKWIGASRGSTARSYSAYA